jgi:hypothetical protein
VLLAYVRRLVKRLTRGTARKAQSKCHARRFRPWLEGLEDRTVPTTFTWTGSTGGLWSTAANWDQNAVPTTGSDVVVNNGTTSVDNVSVEINALTVGATSVLSIGGGSLTLDAAAALAGSISLSSGTLATNVDQTLPPNTAWTGGTLSSSAGNSWTNNGTVSITGTNFVTLVGTLNNAGTITHAPGSGSNEIAFEGAVLNNSGTYDIQGDGVEMSAFAGSGNVFNNTGTFQKSAGTGTTVGAVLFNNAGTVNAESGTLSLAAVAQVSVPSLTGGTWHVFTNSTLNLNGGVSLTTSSGTIILDGSNANFTNIPNLATNNGTVTLQGNTGFTTAGDFTNNGTLDVEAGSTFTVNGSLTNFSGGTLTDGTYLIAGTFQFAASGIQTDAAAISLTGTAAAITDLSGNNLLNGLTSITAAGSLSLVGSNLTVGNLTSAGAVSIDAGSTLSGGTYAQTGGTTVVDGTLATGPVGLQGGTLSGTGTIIGDLTNAASVSIGDTSTTGTLTLTGNYTQTGAGTLIVKLAAVGEADRLVVQGEATLDGTLNVVLVGSYVPLTGDQFVVVTTGGSEAGAFANLAGSGSLFTPTYDPMDVAITAN